MYKNIKWKKHLIEKRGLRSESYIGSSFTKQLGCTNFFKRIKFNIHEEIWIIIHTIIKNEKNFEPDKAKEILDKLIKYNENENNLLLNFKYTKYDSSHSESKNDKTDTLSSGNVGSSENNASINTIKKEKKKKKKGKKEKETVNTWNWRRKKIIWWNKKNKDIDGDFDVIIPNVEREKFKEMIINNFYYGNKSNSYIIFGKKTLDELPEVFHLFIEVGLNVFEDEIKYKSFQINKYIAIVNLANEIGNDDIKNKYKDNWRNRLNLDKNLEINEIIADKYVYMLISNSEYSAFTYRFLDKKNYESEDENKDNKEYKKLLKEDSKEFLFCGYVDFEKDINGIRGLNIKMEKHKEVMEAKMEAQKKDRKHKKLNLKKTWLF